MPRISKRHIFIAVALLFLANDCPSLPDVWIDGTYTAGASPFSGLCEIRSGDSRSSKAEAYIDYPAADSLQPTIAQRVYLRCQFVLLNPQNDRPDFAGETVVFSALLTHLPTDSSASGEVVIKDFSGDLGALSRPGASVTMLGGQFSAFRESYRARDGWIIVKQSRGRIETMRFHLLLKSIEAPY